MIWQMTVALLHSNGQLRTGRDGDTEKGCQKSALQQKTTDDDFNDLSLYSLTPKIMEHKHRYHLKLFPYSLLIIYVYELALCCEHNETVNTASRSYMIYEFMQLHLRRKHGSDVSIF